MDTHNPDQASTEQKRSSREKFPEPRSWALEWHAQHIDQLSTPNGNGSPVEQEQKRSSGEKFPEPRGWAAKWDGLVLSEMQD